MAYTIISQNNNTTTLSDGVNTITVPSRVNLTSGNFTIVEVNNNMATLEDGDGNVYRDIPCVATLAGEGGGGSGLPDQTGHSGEFLTTDGTDASWAGNVVVDTGNKNVSSACYAILGGTASGQYGSLGIAGSATGAESIGIRGNVSGERSIGIGGPVSGSESVVVGKYATANAGQCVAVGKEAKVENSSHSNSIVIGYTAKSSAIGAIQIGKGTNSTAGTMSVSLTTDGTNFNNYELLSADGTIPTARLTKAINKYSTMPTAAADNEGWIVQFTGTTDANYTHGYIYECVSDGGNPATYSWTAVEVQAGGGLPSQSGNDGKFLTTDGTDASWSDKPLVNKATGDRSLVLNINPNATSTDLGGGSNVMIGFGSKVQSTSSNYNTLIGYGAITGSGTRTENIAIGRGVTASANKSIVIGQNSSVTADYAIQLGNNGFNVALNPDANTFKVANNNGNFEIMDANGNLPADRLASTTGLADGNYRLRLTMASGVPTLSWVAE